VRIGEWVSAGRAAAEATEKGIQPNSISRSVKQIWRLSRPGGVGDAGAARAPHGPGLGRRESAFWPDPLCRQCQRPIEHLALVIEFPSEKEDATTTLYQHYRITELPSGWLGVRQQLAPAINLKYAPRIYLQAFLARPQAGFFRISK